MDHKVSRPEKRTDYNDYIGRCACGYAFSSTYQAVTKRLRIHEDFFASEEFAWSDPRRRTQMPSIGAA